MILSNPKIEEMKDDQLEPDIQQFNMRFKTDEENNKTISFILTNLRFIGIMIILLKFSNLEYL